MKAEYIDHLGSDLTVVNAARVSFDKESEWDLQQVCCGNGTVHGCCGDPDCLEVLSEKDQKLITYLAKHNHFSPFTHAVITVRETVPIFVARQRFKHTVGFTYNEVSRRYVDDTPEFFIPDVWRSRPDGNVKQGSGDGTIETIRVCSEYDLTPHSIYEEAILACEYAYKLLLDGGVAPEQARMVLPQSMYTSYYCTGSLAAFARAYKLRIDPHSQKEIQDLAAQWNDIIEPLFPHSWKALTQ